jgi:hypothetical protein
MRRDGRHLCLASMERLVDFADRIADMCPAESPVHWRSISDKMHQACIVCRDVCFGDNIFIFTSESRKTKQGWFMRAKEASKKLTYLGVGFVHFDATIIRKAVDCFRSKGLI